MQSEDTVGPGGVPVQGMRSNNAIHLTLREERNSFNFQFIHP